MARDYLGPSDKALIKISTRDAKHKYNPPEPRLLRRWTAVKKSLLRLVTDPAREPGIVPLPILLHIHAKGRGGTDGFGR